jgi:hypothetical protein
LAEAEQKTYAAIDAGSRNLEPNLPDLDENVLVISGGAA